MYNLECFYFVGRYEGVSYHDNHLLNMLQNVVVLLYGLGMAIETAVPYT